MSLGVVADLAARVVALLAAAVADARARLAVAGLASLVLWPAAGVEATARERGPGIAASGPPVDGAARGAGRARPGAILVASVEQSHARMVEGTLAALDSSVDQNPIGVALELGEPRRRDDGYYLVPIVVRLAIGSLALEPSGPTEDASVRLFVATRDSIGGTSDVQQVPVPIRIPRAEVASARGKSFVYSMTLLMRGGVHRVAVGVLDQKSARSAFVTRSVTVGPRPSP
jgi:hypothetical protein